MFWVTDDGTMLVVVWSDATCTIGSAGLLASLCTCPSRKLCRHRVRTVLHMRGQASTAEPESEPASEPESEQDSEVEVAAHASVPGGPSSVDYDLGALRRQAGAGLWRKACDLMVRGLQTRIEADDLVIFPSLGVRVRFAPGLAIEAALCSCGVVGLCEHRLIAALAFHDDIPDVHARPKAAIDQSCALLWPRVVELMRVGLDSLPVEVAGDLHLLSRQIDTTIPAAGDDLRALAVLIEANARRSARYSSSAWLIATSRLAARLIALQSELGHRRRQLLVGRSRRDYVEASSLRLWALGAEGFRGPRGTLLRLWFVQPETGGFHHTSIGRAGPSPVSPWPHIFDGTCSPHSPDARHSACTSRSTWPEAVF